MSATTLAETISFQNLDLCGEINRNRLILVATRSSGRNSDIDGNARFHAEPVLPSSRESTLVRTLWHETLSATAALWPSKESAAVSRGCIILDEISLLEWIGIPNSELVRFLRAVRSLCLQVRQSMKYICGTSAHWLAELGEGDSVRSMSYHWSCSGSWTGPGRGAPTLLDFDV